MPELATPLAFIIFNRPDTTARVFAAIAAVKPKQLFVIADGPRAQRAGEAELCTATRKIIEQVTWRCEVVTHYSAYNLGCRDRVSSGLTWLFEQVPEAIILEDDCVPHPTFFPYCETLLERYRDDARVGMICGDNFQFGRTVGDGSYYFSKYTHIWGWAGWRRAWAHYDVKASLWPEFLASGCFEQATLPIERNTWNAAFRGVHDGRIDTWDYQWTLACWAHSMLNVVPAQNLITNIGFGPAATHTHAVNRYANMEAYAATLPLVEPSLLAAHAAADLHTARGMFTTSPLRRLMRLGGRLAGVR